MKKKQPTKSENGQNSSNGVSLFELMKIQDHSFRHYRSGYDEWIKSLKESDVSKSA